MCGAPRAPLGGSRAACGQGLQTTQSCTRGCWEIFCLFSKISLMLCYFYLFIFWERKHPEEPPRSPPQRDKDQNGSETEARCSALSAGSVPPLPHPLSQRPLLCRSPAHRPVREKTKGRVSVTSAGVLMSQSPAAPRTRLSGAEGGGGTAGWGEGVCLWPLLSRFLVLLVTPAPCQVSSPARCWELVAEAPLSRGSCLREGWAARCSGVRGPR